MAGLLETLRRAWGAAWDTPNTTDYLRRDLTWASPAAGSGAPTTAQYVTLATDATLTVERVLTAGTAISLTDAGAGSTITVAVSDAELLAIAGTTSAADALPYFTGAGTATTTTLTTQARALLDDTTAAAQRATVGASAVTVNGGSLADVDLDDATPAAGAGDLNVKWQQSGANVSAYVDVSALEPLLSVGAMSGGWTTIAKAADETVSSLATVQDDDDLTVSIPDGETYLLELMLFYSTTAAADFKFKWDRSNIGFWRTEGRYIVPAATAFSSVAVGDNPVAGELSLLSASGTNGAFHLHAIVTASGGTAVVKVQWSQVTSTAVNTTVYKGSHLKWIKVQ
jgi:hypothetical protein